MTFQGPKSKLGQELKVPGTQASVPSTISHGLPELQTTSRMTKQQARETGHMNGQIVEGKGVGRRSKGLKDTMVLQKSICK